MRFIAKESSAAETIGKQWIADKCGYRDGVRNMNTDVGAELRSRLRARSGSATGCHRQAIHYRPPCGARNFLLATARKISTAARFTPCLLPPQAADVCRNVIYINFVLRHPMYRLAAALRCPKFLCSLPLREISTAARFTPCLLPPPAAARRETPFKSKQKSTSMKCSPNRDSFSPAGSVRVGYGRPPDCHSLPSALRCPKFLARCRSRNFDRCTFRALPSSAAGGGKA